MKKLTKGEAEYLQLLVKSRQLFSLSHLIVASFRERHELLVSARIQLTLLPSIFSLTFVQVVPDQFRPEARNFRSDFLKPLDRFLPHRSLFKFNQFTLSLLKFSANLIGWPSAWFEQSRSWIEDKRFDFSEAESRDFGDASRQSTGWSRIVTHFYSEARDCANDRRIERNPALNLKETPKSALRRNSVAWEEGGRSSTGSATSFLTNPTWLTEPVVGPDATDPKIS